jgi:hypothetical protein
MSEARLEWSLRPSADGSALIIEYEVTGGPEQPLYLLDRILHRGAGGALSAEDDRVIVLPGDTPGTVRFVRGFVRGAKVRRRSIEIVPAPAGRKVNFGETVHGEARVPLPIKPWHNFEPPDPLVGTPTTAVLEIGYLIGESDWARKKLVDGTEVTVPQPPQVPKQKFLRGEPLPVPAR